MKKLNFALLPLFALFTTNAFSAGTILFVYDPNFYSEAGIEEGITYDAGTLTAISDIYYYYDIVNLTMQTSQTEWLSTGLAPIGTTGSEEAASYDSTFNYTGITFENMQSVLTFIPDYVYDDFLTQFAEISSLSISIPYKTNAISKHIKNLFNTNINMIDNRIDSPITNGISVYANQTYNQAKQNGYFGFSDTTTGVSLGIDNKINDNMLFGIGYSLNNTDIKAYKDIIKSDGHNFYLYSKYKIDRLYFQELLNFGFAKYDREIINDVSSEKIESSHNVYNYGVALKTGYEMPNGLTPEIGFRYIYISQDFYKDSTGREIFIEGNGTLTLVSGIKYKYNFDTISLKTKLNFIYDIINDADVINTDYYGYKSQIIGESLNPFGIESGLALETSFDKFNVSLEYDFSFKENFQNHTGMIKMKYSF